MIEIQHNNVGLPAVDTGMTPQVRVNILARFILHSIAPRTAAWIMPILCSLIVRSIVRLLALRAHVGTAIRLRSIYVESIQRFALATRATTLDFHATDSSMEVAQESRTGELNPDDQFGGLVS
jgi:hypothetical protein